MGSSVHSWRSSSSGRSSYSSKNSKSDSAGFYDDEASLERGDSSLVQYDEDERSHFGSFASIFLDIPFPAFLHICSFLTEDDYLTLLEVSRFFHRAITQADSVVWKALCFDKWKNRQGCHHFILFYQQLQKECVKHDLQITALTQRKLLEEMQSAASVVDHSPTSVAESSECHQNGLHFPPYQESTLSMVDTEASALPDTDAVRTSPRISEAVGAAPTSSSPSTSLCSFPSFLAIRSRLHQKGQKIDFQKVNHSHSHASPPTSSFHSVFGKLSSEVTTPQGSSFANSMKSSTNWSSCWSSSSTSYRDSPPCRSIFEKFPPSPKVECNGCSSSSTRMNMVNEKDERTTKISFFPYPDSESHRKKSRKHVYQHRGIRRTRRYKRNHHPQHCKHRHRAKSHHKRNKKKCHTSSHQKSNPKMSRSARRRLRHQRSKQKALLLQEQPLEPTATLNAIHSTTPSIPLNRVDPCPLFSQKCLRGCTNPPVGVLNASEPGVGRKGFPSERSPIRTYWWDFSHEKRTLLLSQQQRRQEKGRRTDKENSNKDSTLNDEESVTKMLDVSAEGRDEAKLSSVPHGVSTEPEESDDSTLPSRTSEGVSTELSANANRRRRWSFHMDEENMKTNGLLKEEENESSPRVHFSPTVVVTENSRCGERSGSFHKTGIYQNSFHLALHSTSNSTGHNNHKNHDQVFYPRKDFMSGSNYFPYRPNSFTSKICCSLSALEESLLRIRASFTSRSTMGCRSTALAACDISPQNSSTLSFVKDGSPLRVTPYEGSLSLPISASTFASAAPPLLHPFFSRFTQEGTQNGTFLLSPHLDTLNTSSPSVPLQESRSNRISLSAFPQAEGETSTRGDCNVAVSASACSSPQETDFSPSARCSNLPTAAKKVVPSASTVSLSPVVPTSTASSTLKEEDKHERSPLSTLDSNQKDDPRENDEGDAIEYGPMSWKFAYYMSRRESRRKTITLDELTKGLWLACFRSTGRCHPVRFLESHQMEIFPPLPEVGKETRDSDLTQRDAVALDRRGEGDERSDTTIDTARIPTYTQPQPSNSREEVPYGSTFPIAIDRFHVMQSGGALTLVPSSSNGMKPLIVQHRSSLATTASNDLHGNCSGCHNLLCKTPVPSSGVETSDPLAKFIAEPNYSVARLRQGAENLVLGKYRTENSSPTRGGNLNFQPFPSGEGHFSCDEKKASAFQEASSFHSAIRFLFGWETSKRSFPNASRWIPPNVSAEDENAVDDDWGWTISNDALKIFSVEVSHALYVERLKRACEQKCYLS